MEVVEKFQNFEGQALTKISGVVAQGSDLYTVQPPPRKAEGFTNPRLTEFHRAAETLSTAVFSMHTQHQPWWSMEPLQFPEDFDQLETIENTIEAQLDASDWNVNHLKALRYAAVDGSVIVQEDFAVVGRGPQGIYIPVTNYRPMRIDQVAYDEAATSVDEADWIATASLISNGQIKALAGHNKNILGRAWIGKGLDNALAIEEDPNRMNSLLKARMVRGGVREEELNKKRELIMYYGKLEALNDGVEYVVGIINRKTLVRFHHNNFQHGRRQFRWGNWLDFDRLRGYGLTELFGAAHSALDSHLQRILDAQAFSEFGMLGYKSGEFDVNEAEIAPLALLPMEDKDSLFSIPGGNTNPQGSLALMNLMVNNLRAATKANDTIQGMTTGGTATGDALAQNEGLRGIRVIAEGLAHNLQRKHLQVMHGNNSQLIKDSFPLSVRGVPRMAYPKDFKLYADFKVQIVSDKDFNPNERRELLELLQIITSTKNTDPTLSRLVSRPILAKLMRGSGFNPNSLGLDAAAPAAGSELDAAGMVGMDAGSLPPEAGFNAANGQVGGTPVGPVQITQ